MKREMVNNETKWMLRALIALAKRKLADANESRENEGDWPAGKEWHELGDTSQHAFMSAAREEAGIPRAEYRELIEDVAMNDSLGDLDAIWEEMERPNGVGQRRDD